MADGEWLKRPPFTLERGAVWFLMATLWRSTLWSFFMGSIRSSHHNNWEEGMRAMPSKRSGRVLALALTLGSLPMLTQAEVVGQAAASISNYGFSLRDLNPDDGVTPTFTARYWWDDSAQVSTLKYGYNPGFEIMESGFDTDRGLRSPSVDLFKPTPLATNLPSGDARAEVKPGGVSAAVTLNSDGFIGANYSLSPYGTWVDDYKTSPVWAGGPELLA
jgi:hypothetical protein